MVPPQEVTLPEEEGGAVVPSPVELPLKAIVRIRIPLKRPPQRGEKGSLEQQNTQELDNAAGDDSGKCYQCRFFLVCVLICNVETLSFCHN